MRVHASVSATSSVGCALKTVGKENILRILNWEQTAHPATSLPHERAELGWIDETAEILESVSWHFPAEIVWPRYSISCLQNCSFSWDALCHLLAKAHSRWSVSSWQASKEEEGTRRLSTYCIKTEALRSVTESRSCFKHCEKWVGDSQYPGGSLVQVYCCHW